MFRGREEQFAEDLAAELEPHQNTAIDYEAEERLRAFDAELMLAGRHLLNSNDRYQISAAHLVMARNQFLVASTITSAMVQTSREEDRRGPSFSRDHVVTFLRNTFQSSRSYLETADSIANQPGYTADDEHVETLRQAGARMQWLATPSVSSRFVRGTVEAADKINGYAAMGHYELERASNLLPGYKPHLDGRVQPLFVTADTRRKAIERVMGSGMLQKSPESAIADIYDDAQVAIGALNQISLFLTYPQMYDRNLRVRNPIHEDRPGERSFNPTVLGSAPPAPAPRPPRPVVPPRPFDASTLPPAPVTRPAPPQRPFNAGVLPPAPASKQPRQPGASESEHPFDPSILGAPNAPRVQPVESREEHPFDPSILGRPNSPSPEQHDEHPFDPSILGRPNVPPTQAHPFDPKILDRKTNKTDE
jgi:hypothetical protein